MDINDKMSKIDQRLNEIDSEMSRLSSLKRKLIQAKEKLKDEKYLKKQNELENNDWSQGGSIKHEVHSLFYRDCLSRCLPLVANSQRKAENSF